MPWLRKVCQIGWIRVLTDDDGRFYVRWSRDGRIRRVVGRRSRV